MRDEAEVAYLREIADRDRAVVDGEKARMQAAVPYFETKVQLNVGGVRFNSGHAAVHAAKLQRLDARARVRAL